MTQPPSNNGDDDDGDDNDGDGGDGGYGDDFGLDNDYSQGQTTSQSQTSASPATEDDDGDDNDGDDDGGDGGYGDDYSQPPSKTTTAKPRTQAPTRDTDDDDDYDGDGNDFGLDNDYASPQTTVKPQTQAPEDNVDDGVGEDFGLDNDNIQPTQVPSATKEAQATTLGAGADNDAYYGFYDGDDAIGTFNSDTNATTSARAITTPATTTTTTTTTTPIPLPVDAYVNLNLRCTALASNTDRGAGSRPSNGKYGAPVGFGDFGRAPTGASNLRYPDAALGSSVADSAAATASDFVPTSQGLLFASSCNSISLLAVEVVQVTFTVAPTPAFALCGTL